MASSSRVQTIASHLKSNVPPQQQTATKKYVYTFNESGILTTEQRDFYEENGYLVIPKLVSDERIDGYYKAFKNICANPEVRPRTLTVMRDIALAKQGVSPNSELVITKLQDFHEVPELFAYCEDPEILKYVEAWTGPRIVASHTMLINKPTDPGKGTSRHPLHQDMLYFPFRPMEKVVASWTAMEKVDRSNGCLIAVPGSHRTELLEHGYPDWEGGVNKAYVGISGVTPDVKYVHIPMEKGDTIFFHPLLWHGSGRNQTPNFRKAISCHFVSGDCHFINVRNTIQADLELDIRDIFGKKLKAAGLDDESIEETLKQYQMKDVWEFKSRIVRGDQMIQSLESSS